MRLSVFYETCRKCCVLITYCGLRLLCLSPQYPTHLCTYCPSTHLITCSFIAQRSRQLGVDAEVAGTTFQALEVESGQLCQSFSQHSTRSFHSFPCCFDGQIRRKIPSNSQRPWEVLRSFRRRPKSLASNSCRRSSRGFRSTIQERAMIPKYFCRSTSGLCDQVLQPTTEHSSLSRGTERSGFLAEEIV